LLYLDWRKNVTMLVRGSDRDQQGKEPREKNLVRIRGKNEPRATQEHDGEPETPENSTCPVLKDIGFVLQGRAERQEELKVWGKRGKLRLHWRYCWLTRMIPFFEIGLEPSEKEKVIKTPAAAAGNYRAPKRKAD